jgi:hypothetical protein
MRYRQIALLAMPLLACGLLRDSGEFTATEDDAGLPSSSGRPSPPVSSSGSSGLGSSGITTSSGGVGTSSSGSATSGSSGLVGDGSADGASSSSSSSSSSGMLPWVPLTKLGPTPVDCSMFTSKKFCDNFEGRAAAAQGWDLLTQTGATAQLRAAAFIGTQVLSVDFSGNGSQGFLTKNLPAGTTSFAYVFRTYIAGAAVRSDAPTILAGVASPNDRVNLALVALQNGSLQIAARNLGGTQPSALPYVGNTPETATISVRMVYRAPMLTIEYRIGETPEATSNFSIANVTSVTLGVVSGNGQSQANKFELDDVILDYP